jgi:hypothetical protein
MFSDALQKFHVGGVIGARSEQLEKALDALETRKELPMEKPAAPAAAVAPAPAPPQDLIRILSQLSATRTLPTGKAGREELIKLQDMDRFRDLFDQAREAMQNVPGGQAAALQLAAQEANE